MTFRHLSSMRTQRQLLAAFLMPGAGGLSHSLLWVPDRRGDRRALIVML